MFKKTLLLLLVSCICNFSFAQTRQELERKQQDLLKEISSLNATLNDIRKTKKQSIGQLELVKRKINAREELIGSINKDIRSLDNNIYTSTLEINRLKRELDTLKGEYAQSLLFAYKNRSNYDYLNFIFSAASFNDAVKRITYLKSYRQYREEQVSNINKTQALIENKIASLNNSKTEKSVALQDQGKQLKVLETDRKEQNEVVTQLSSKVNEITAQIRNRDRQRQKMKEAIAAVIRRELRDAQERARIAKAKEADRLKKERDAAAALARTTNNNTPPKTTAKPSEPATEGVATNNSKEKKTYTPFESTEEGKAETVSFENGKGSLPWPADQGYISIHFGRYVIPGSKISGQSEGISIALPVGASIKAVAPGEVLSVYDLEGEQAVLVKHGKYITIYSHLASANVSRGQQVRAGTVVGRAAANEDGEGEMLFMVTNEKGTPLNPEGWLRRK